MTDTSVMEAARKYLMSFDDGHGGDTDAAKFARALIRMHAAMTEIANLEMGRGDGVVGDYITSVQEIAAAALSDESVGKS